MQIDNPCCGSIGFVHQYEISYQPIADKQQTVNKQWWYDHWNDFSNAPVKFESQYPLTVQWQGDIENIETLLNDNGWVTAPKFNIKNSLNYFLPEPEFGLLPVWSNTLFSDKEALLMLAPGMSNNKFYVLRLWAANPGVANDKIQLYVGAVHSIDILSVFKLLHLPIVRSDYSESLALLHSKIHSTTPPLLIRQELYADMGVTDSWKGEVLLLEFSGANNTPSGTSGTTNSSLQQVGNTGLYLKYPKHFVPQDVPGVLVNAGQQSQLYFYELRDNGVVVNVSYVSNVSADLTLKILRQQLRRQLDQLEWVEGLEVTEFPEKFGSVDGIHMIARYDLPPFGKQMAYHVLAAIEGANMWQVAVSLKDCDADGQRRVDDMLASIAILP